MKYFPKIRMGLAVSALFFTSTAQGFLLSGRILEKGSRAPLPGADMVLEETAGKSSNLPELSPTPDPPARSFSPNLDVKGFYQLELPEGTYRLRVRADGYKPIDQGGVEVHHDLRKDFYLEREGFNLPEVLVSAEKTSKAQVSRETLSKEELASVPGTGGDVLRALQALPGVNVAGDFSDALLIRGAGPLDNLYLLDGIPLIFPFHFGGLLSTLNSDLIQKVDFSAGGFGPSHGSYYGGLIEVAQRAPRGDRWGGRVEVTPIFSEASWEGPLAQGLSLSLSGRRSYLEVLGGLLDQFDPVPAFYDYQSKLSWNASSQTRVDFQSFGSSDNLGLKFKSGFTLAPNVIGSSGNLLYHNGFDSQGVHVRWVGPGSDSLSDTAYHTTFSMGVSLTQGFFNLTSEDFGNRFDWVHDFDGESQIQLGWEYVHGLRGGDLRLDLLSGQDDLDPFNFLVEPMKSSRFTAVSDNLGFYLDQKFQTPDHRLGFSLGGRWDFQSYNHMGDPSPRFSLDYHFSEDTLLKASYGFYTQTPFQGLYSAPGYGNPQLTSEMAASAVLGLEQKIGRAFSLRLEGYQKNLSRVIEVDPYVNYNNQGTGTSRGVELFLRAFPTDRFFGWISYSLSDSQRRNSPDAPVHPYIYDQPQVVTLVASAKITSGWDAGIKWHYASGLPFTPIIGSVYDVLNQYYRPIYGLENSARMPDYLRLDFSTSFKTVYDTWQWRIYLEVWNVTNHDNVLTYTYNNDLSQSQSVGEFPLLPYLGFEAIF